MKKIRPRPAKLGKMKTLTLESIKKILSVIRYRDWKFFLGKMGEGFFIQVRFMEKDIHTSKLEEQHGRKWYVSQYSTEDEVVRTCFLAVMVASEHEIRESFFFNGKNIFGPHIATNALEKISDKRAFREAKK